MHQARVEEYITRSFRDVADEDYVTARVLWRGDLYLQFLWSALQSVEKYLKATLLYRGYRIREKHNLERLLARVARIEDLSFTAPDEVVEMIRYLNRQGNNRYFEFPVDRIGRERERLDQTVRCLRPICAPPNGVRPFRGRLERILDGGNEFLREALVWENPYYGSQSPGSTPDGDSFPAREHPTTFLYPEVYEELKDRLPFSKAIRKHFDELSRNGREIPNGDVSNSGSSPTIAREPVQEKPNSMSGD